MDFLNKYILIMSLVIMDTFNSVLSPDITYNKPETAFIASCFKQCLEEPPETDRKEVHTHKVGFNFVKGKTTPTKYDNTTKVSYSIQVFNDKVVEFDDTNDPRVNPELIVEGVNLTRLPLNRSRLESKETRGSAASLNQNSSANLNDQSVYFSPTSNSEEFFNAEQMGSRVAVTSPRGDVITPISHGFQPPLVLNPFTGQYEHSSSQSNDRSGLPPLSPRFDRSNATSPRHSVTSSQQSNSQIRSRNASRTGQL